jgi:hypothetical protein
VHRHVISGLALASLGAVTGMSAADDTSGAAGALRYPVAGRGATVDVLHGVEVADPYRWMEKDSAELSAWVAAENAIAEPYLGAIPAREAIKRRLTELWNYEQYGYSWLDDKARVPVKKGGRYFYVEKSGTQNQGILYWTASLDAAPKVLVDPNTLSADATASLASYSISPDGRIVAYAVSDGGTDWDTWQLREVETGRDLPERIVDTKFTGVSWVPDASAFYYSRYPKGADGKGNDQQQVSVYRHRLGTMQADDELVYTVTDNARYNPYGIVTEDGRWLVLVITHGFESNAIHLRDVSKPDSEVIRLFDRWDGIYDFLGVLDGRLFFRTTQGTPLGRVISVDPTTRAVAEVVPESKQTLYQASLAGGRVIASYLEDARTRVSIYGQDGRRQRDLALPGQGTAIGFPDAPGENESFFAYTDYLTPLALYRYDIAADRVAPFRKPTVSFDPAPFVTEQVFFPSRDGTRVPMFITRRKDAAVRLRRFRRLADADLQRRGCGLARAGRHLRGRQPARRRRVRGRLARRRNADEEAKRIRRLHRRGRVARREGLYLAGEARDPRSQQRRTPRRRGDGAASRAVRGRAARRRRDGHAALPHGERECVCLVVRLRDRGGRGPVPCAARLLAAAQPGGRPLLPADAGDDGRPRRPRRAVAQLQVRGGTPACAGLRQPGADTHRDPRRPRRRQADLDAGGGLGQPVGFPG